MSCTFELSTCHAQSALPLYGPIGRLAQQCACNDHVPKASEVLGSCFGRTDFLQIFMFGRPDFFADFVADFFSSFLLKKVPRKILQQNPRQNPPKFTQQKSPTHFCRGAGPRSGAQSTPLDFVASKSIRQEKRAQRLSSKGPETARWGGGLPREGVVAEKFVPSLESWSSLGFEERNPLCPRNFAGMSRTPGGVQKVCAKKVHVHFSFPSRGGSYVIFLVCMPSLLMLSTRPLFRGRCVEA